MMKGLRFYLLLGYGLLLLGFYICLSGFVLKYNQTLAMKPELNEKTINPKYFGRIRNTHPIRIWGGFVITFGFFLTGLGRPTV